jgi:NCS1 family nucleobase:cation symporter-1
VLGILPNVPGFLVQIKIISPNSFPAWINQLYNYAWFAGFFVAGISYLLLMNSYKKIIHPVNTTYVAAD